MISSFAQTSCSYYKNSFLSLIQEREREKSLYINKWEMLSVVVTTIFRFHRLYRREKIERVSYVKSRKRGLVVVSFSCIKLNH